MISSMNYIVFLLILLCACFNTVAQIMLKTGMDRIGHFEFNWHNVIPIALQVALSPWVIFGLSFYIGSVIVWLMVLSRVPVSMAYPVSSISYITSAIAAYYLLGEDFGVMRIAGILIILTGVYLVAKS
jgi:multidrug transporter EmrE-like cation transporter